MKWSVILLVLLSNICKSQGWQAEVMVGLSGYNGDLTQKEVSFNRMRPAANFKLIYNTGDFINFRLGLGYGKISGDDKTNSSADLKSRNLNFQSNILEANVCVEFNLLDPMLYNQYPYVFTGIGVFHFDPYTFDKDNKKTFLQPLSTEGQGLPEFPERKPYSLTQVCVPIGLGWKIKKGRWEIGYEFGYRFLFTDYLDDISKTYVSQELLNAKKGPKSAELANRQLGGPFNWEGEIRGNSKVRDSYFMSGFRFATYLGKQKKKTTNNKSNKKNKSVEKKD